MKRIAFFDLDHTLVDGDSDSSFLDYLVEQGAAPETVLRDKEPINRAYMAGEPWQADYLELLALIYGGRDVRPVEELARTHAEQRVAPMFFSGASALIESERRRCDALCLLTTTNQVVATPVARLLGLDAVLSTRLVVSGDRFTGELEGNAFCTGPEKAAALERYCEQAGVSPRSCAMYGDGRSDMEALAVVGDPYAVHPNDELRRRANELDWPILDLTAR